ncbi:MAG: hypothetical protein JXM70_26205, partial [Pirellulales bacterium]|nr:hypothetical protein [Pirellulales bacterium]
MTISFETLLVFVCSSLLAQLSAGEAPWAANKPIVKVRKEVYIHHPKSGTAAMVSVRRVGLRGELEEWRTTMGTSDTPKSPRRRWSSDEGRTWSDFEPMPPLVFHSREGIEV